MLRFLTLCAIRRKAYKLWVPRTTQNKVSKPKNWKPKKSIGRNTKSRLVELQIAGLN